MFRNEVKVNHESRNDRSGFDFCVSSRSCARQHGYDRFYSLFNDVAAVFVILTKDTGTHESKYRHDMGQNKSRHNVCEGR